MEQETHFQPRNNERTKTGLTWTGAILLAFIVAFVFGVSGCFLGTAVGGVASAGSANGLQEILIDGKAGSEKKIAAIPIKGVIMESMGAGPGTVSQVKSSLKAIKKDENVVGILLVIDTPGGGVTASDRIYHDLLEFKKESELPVHALFLDVAASGGYYVAMASDHITAHPTTVTGSIGVISKFFNFTEAMDKVGVSVNVVKSLNSEGKVSFKDIGSPYRPMREDERLLLQALITEMWERFTDIVAAGRKGKIEPSEVRKLADGRVFTGKQALELKLIDAIGYSEDAYAEIRKASGREDAKIVAFRKEPGLAQILGLKASTDLGALSLSPSQLAKQVLSEQSGFLYLWTAGGH